MEMIALGTITNVHGIKGAVTVKTDSDFRQDRYQLGNRLYIGFKHDVLPVTISGHFIKGKLDVLSFAEYDSRTAVQPFKGSVIYIAEVDRPALTEPDAYYYSELIGLDVWTDEKIGIVKAVRETPQGHLLIVERPNQKDALIPFQKEFVDGVTDTRITVIVWEGLL